MAEKKKVNLTKAMTFAGSNYPPGLNEMPENAAAYAVRRKFGAIAGQSAQTEEAGSSEAGGGQTGGGEGESGGKTEDGLPEDFPMKHVFEKAGFKSVGEIQAKSREDLIALDGVAEKTADKALAYGK